MERMEKPIIKDNPLLVLLVMLLVTLCFIGILIWTGKREINTEKVTVREGDTLSEIAEEHNVDLDEILTLNVDVIPENIKPGQVISLPAQETKKDLTHHGDKPGS